MVNTKQVGSRPLLTEKTTMEKKRNPHNVLFIEALIMAIFVFALGLMLGFFIEDGRAGQIEESYWQSQVNLLDIQTLSDLIGDGDYSCEYRIEKNTEFGNKIYDDALLFEQYEEAQTFGDKLVAQHRIYDLLRTIFWINSIELRKECPELNTIVYLYNYNEQLQNEKQKQEVFSRFAGELKDELGENSVLIPIAINLDIASLEILKNRYGVQGTTILINDKTRLTRIEDIEEFRLNAPSLN